MFNLFRDTTENHIFACKTSFEVALFGAEARDEKPYNALTKMDSEMSIENRVKQLLDCLLDPTIAPPTNCVRWNKISDLV